MRYIRSLMQCSWLPRIHICIPYVVVWNSVSKHCKWYVMRDVFHLTDRATASYKGNSRDAASYSDGWWFVCEMLQWALTGFFSTKNDHNQLLQVDYKHQNWSKEVFHMTVMTVLSSGSKCSRERERKEKSHFEGKCWKSCDPLQQQFIKRAEKKITNLYCCVFVLLAVKTVKVSLWTALHLFIVLQILRRQIV